MDTGNGNFERLMALKEKHEQSKEENDKTAIYRTEQEMKKLEEKYPNHGGWFHVGQIVDVEGSSFRVKSVKPTELRLKLLRRVK
jgi:hypothetical protein